MYYIIILYRILYHGVQLLCDTFVTMSKNDNSRLYITARALVYMVYKMCMTYARPPKVIVEQERIMR